MSEHIGMPTAPAHAPLAEPAGPDLSAAHDLGPVVARTRDELKAARARLTDGDVAVVMTMGALHEGHATLIETARQRAAHVVVTI